MATKVDIHNLGPIVDLNQPNQNIDRRKCHRTVPMQVLSLGAPRTGTMSMCQALRILGYAHPYHMASILSNFKDCEMWLDAIDAKCNPQSTKKPFGRAEFDGLLGHCSGVLDLPGVLFWRELVEAYPEAKVVLVQRNEESWLRSMRTLLHEGVLNPLCKYVFPYTDPNRVGALMNVGRESARYFLDTEGPLTLDNMMKNASEAYRTHYREIRKTVPSERLLEYKLGTGWEPLCEFLGKDVPDIPFPHLNDAETVKQTLQAFILQGVVASLKRFAVVIGTGATLYLAWRWNKSGQ